MAATPTPDDERALSSPAPPLSLSLRGGGAVCTPSPHSPPTTASCPDDENTRDHTKKTKKTKNQPKPKKQETSAALAKDGEFGSVLEGRFVALAHPAVMGALFLYTGYAGWLGWQWRRTRTIGDDIKALKATAPKPAVNAEGVPVTPPSPVDQQITALETVSVFFCFRGGDAEEEGDQRVPACAERQTTPRRPSSRRAIVAAPPSHQRPKIKPTKKPTKKQKQERKELVQGGYRDKHFNAGSILLAGGVIIAIEGCLNTYMRTGKLFPGPHLFAGAAIVALWAAAASLVPAMQKGNDNARSAHIALNAVNMALFAWQVPTGLEIVGKVFQFVPKWF